MSSPLVKPDLELSPLSLLVLCDLADAPKGRRRFDRVDTLLKTAAVRLDSNGGRSVPGAVAALELAGFVEVRRATRAKTPDAIPGWSAEITDKGLLLHRCLMAAMRNAGKLVAQ